MYYRTWLTKNRIATSRIAIDRMRHTAVAHIMTDCDDNQIAAFAPGATEIPYPLTQTTMKFFRNARCAIIGPSRPSDIMRQCRALKRARIPYIADPGQEIPALTSSQLLELIRGSEALFGNDYEIELIRQKIKHSRNQLIKRVKFLVITLGAKGSMIYQRDTAWKIAAAPPTRVVDPTGAGDAYRAGFIHGYIRGVPLETCGHIASLVARLPLAHYGTQEHALSPTDRAAIKKLLLHAA